MSEQFNMNAALDMLYLCGCVITGEQAKPERLANIDLQALYAVSQFHSLTALVCEGLQQADYKPTEEMKKYMTAFITVKEKNVRKNLMFDTERAKILSYFEQNGIWYMPLKGIILKDFYPKMGLRQMADNDILFDVTYRKKVRDYFESQGYKTFSYGRGAHDIYQKEPLYNFEMHVTLFTEISNKVWCQDYNDLTSRLIKDEHTNYGRHFSDENFYIHFVVHGFNHFDYSGIGLRYLLDLYVYLKNKQNTMDFAYLTKIFESLGIAEFEKESRELSMAIFSDIQSFDMKNLAEKQQQNLSTCLSSGTYGTFEQNAAKGVHKRGSRFKYLLCRIFPGTVTLKTHYHPIFKHKVLLPVGWAYRAFKLLKSRPKDVIRAVSSIINSKK